MKDVPQSGSPKVGHIEIWATYLGLCSCKFLSQSGHFKNLKIFWFFSWRHHGGHFEFISSSAILKSEPQLSHKSISLWSNPYKKWATKKNSNRCGSKRDTKLSHYHLIWGLLLEGGPIFDPFVTLLLCEIDRHFVLRWDLPLKGSISPTLM